MPCTQHVDTKKEPLFNTFFPKIIQMAIGAHVGKEEFYSNITATAWQNSITDGMP